MKNLYIALAATLLIWQCFAVNGVDLSTLTTVENFKCMMSTHNISFVVMRGYRSFASPDPNVKAVLKAAQDAGIKVTDVYLFPCRGKSPIDQANEAVDYLSTATYGTIWIDVETNTSPGCSWTSSTAADNCNFIDQLVTHLEQRGKKVGIYASAHMWQSIMGSTSACQNFKNLPLWYAHYDSVQAFSDFSTFGGWTKPYAKQYQGTTTMCNTGVDLNWHP